MVEIGDSLPDLVKDTASISNVATAISYNYSDENNNTNIKMMDI